MHAYWLSCLTYICSSVAVQWDKYIQCDRHICSGEYASDVKCMYTSVPGLIMDCSEFIRDMYTDLVVSYQHMN